MEIKLNLEEARERIDSGKATVNEIRKSVALPPIENGDLKLPKFQSDNNKGMIIQSETIEGCIYRECVPRTYDTRYAAIRSKDIWMAYMGFSYR